MGDSPDVRGAAWRYYTAHGWSVIPVRPGEKRPAVRWQDYEVRRPGEGELERWWRNGSRLGVGVVTGRVSGIAVVDADGELGLATLEILELPRTPTVRTGSGGRHLYFRHTGGKICTTAAILPGVDVRGDGGFVVAPPTVHPSGRPYRWEVELGAVPLAPFPERLIRRRTELQPQPVRRTGDTSAYAEAALRGECEEVRRAAVGTRNHTLNLAAFKMGGLVGAGLLDLDRVASQLLSAALACGLPDREARATIASGLKAGISEPRRVG
jgi:Bifunctional DNA primase/polymerase, N-terminal